MGRLTLNILLSFAQFEREIIGERIRDKIGAQKRKGKWAGGAPILGYDVDRSTASPRLVVNAKEAARVREIYRMYLDKGALLPVVVELSQKSWVNKLRVTKKGKKLGGRPFDKATLYMLLTNPLLTGKVKHKDEIYEGEHEAIIDQATFDQVQQQLKRNGRTGGTGGAEVRNKYGAILRGLLRCKSCGASMTHTFSGNSRSNFYRYYRCTRAIKSGRRVCSVGTLPAAEMERVVIDEVRRLATDKAVLAEVLTDAHTAIDAELAGLRRDRDDLRNEAKRHHTELRKLIAEDQSSPDVTSRIADLNQRIAEADRRLPELNTAIADLEAETVSQTEAHAAFADFDGLWESLIPREQARLLKLLLTTRGLRRRRGHRLGHLPPDQHPLPDQPQTRGGRMTTVTKQIHFAVKGHRKRAIDGTAPEGTVPQGRVPRVAKLMALAIRFDDLLRTGKVRDMSELARLAHVSQPRMTQIMNLLHLAPDIQEEILYLPPIAEGRDPITERDTRAISASCSWNEQRLLFRRLSR